MQTFLPYPDYDESARCLDARRLGKQRVEALQILRVRAALTRDPEARVGWRHHPAVRMWAGYEWQLACYALAVCREWRGRGFADGCAEAVRALTRAFDGRWPNRRHPWLGDPALHASHRSNLLRKAPHHYGACGWTEAPDLPYVWPV